MKKSHFILLAIVSLLSSCIADDFDKMQSSNWEPEIAIPLIDSRFGIDRLINKFDSAGLFTTDDDDVIVMVYEDRIFEISADSLFKINDIKFDLAILQNSGIGNLQVGQFLLKSLDLDQGTLLVHIEDDISEDTRVTLNMPKTTKNGVPFEESFTLEYSGLPVTIFDTIFDLSDYLFDLSGNGNQSNNLKINYKANKISNNDSVVLNVFEVEFLDLSYEFMDGNFGQWSLGTDRDSLKLDVFKNFKSGRIILEDPKFQFDITNGFGMPLNVSFGNFEANGSEGDALLTGPGVDNGIAVGAPGGTGSPPSQTNKELNSSNSNISEFFAITPNALKFNFNIEGNADNDTTIYNFINKSSKLVGDIKLSLPFKGSLDSVIIEDIYDFQHEEMKNLDKAEFKLFTLNSFPVGIYMQIYFLDENKTVLDSLIQDNESLFREAIADADGFSIQAVPEESYFTIGQGRFSHIKQSADFLKIKVMLLTDESTKKTIKITDKDYFDFKLGVRAALKL